MPPSPALHGCEETVQQCDAGAECGLCLRLLARSECPAVHVAAALPRCDRTVAVGVKCEGGGGECGTRDDGNNCR